MGKTLKKMRKTSMSEEIYRINQKSETRDLIKFHLCGTTFPDKSYRIKRPLSTISCIEYVEEGCGTVHLDEKIFRPHKGDSYFLQAGKAQYYYSDTETPWKKHFINISGKLAESLAEGYGLSNVSYFEGLDLGNELSRIIELAKNEYDDHTPEFIAILNEIFLKMRNHVKNGDGLPHPEAEMKDFLNTQITSPFRIDLLCKHISKSESQTIRLFKEAFGTTPYAYVLDKKMGLAKKLLTDTNLTVKQIADKLCFADEYYFSNLFKKKTGVTPSAYRKNASALSTPDA